ncbi:DUF126 domain-containing protein [Pseudomaricurvus alkylphenolicus]|uniref:aconitase X swivel domain-containing protein n=1 Tax=Pseudomaricurvus alkylphenolicus TaxID=1306991 RepID=UPI00141E2C01|nr:DUF126 domain-containing protein [Pseudomaricurvus alkylphenolicus]NIB38616.1 DUF126 domain-containing protein [Pseudomaricurvus alkylphenolicus]
MPNIKTFSGRPALKGDASGPAAVTKLGFNATATYMEVLFGGSKSGVCKDHDNPDLYEKDLAGTVLCIPQTIGSSAAACTYMAAVQAGIAPKAMLFAGPMDSIAACGLIMAYYWADKTPIIAVDNLGDEFLETVKTGNRIDVSCDGTVKVHH